MSLCWISNSNQPLAAELKDLCAGARLSQFILGLEVTEFERQVAGVGATRSASAPVPMRRCSADGARYWSWRRGALSVVHVFATAGSVHEPARSRCSSIRWTTISTSTAERRGHVTDKTKAIIPVHLFGQAADMDAVQRLASAHDLMVLEDAAQPMGTQFGEKPPMGDLCAFVFRPRTSAASATVA